MSNYSASRMGQINGSGATDAIFLKVFSGEVLKSFNATNLMMERNTVRTISSGKSAQFPCIGTATAAYHTPGTELTGSNQIKHAEKIINIDFLLESDVFVANIDEAMNHYDVRQEYANQMGQALANAADKKILQVGVLAARASSNITGGNGGTALTNAAFGTSGSTLASGIFSAAQTLDEKFIPASDRFCVVKPAQYYTLVQYLPNINKDWGGAGSYATGDVMNIAGIEIVKSVNLPTTDLSGGSTTGMNNTYLANFSTTVGLVMNKQAVGTVKLLDLAMEKDYLIQNQGTLMVAKYAMGHGILRPECAVELKTA